MMPSDFLSKLNFRGVYLIKCSWLVPLMKIHGMTFLFKEWVPYSLPFNVISLLYQTNHCVYASDNTEILKRILWKQFGGLVFEFYDWFIAT